MNKEELVTLYNKKRNKAMNKYNDARRNYHKTTDSELKKDYEAEKDYYNAHQHFCDEVLRDLTKTSCW